MSAEQIQDIFVDIHAGEDKERFKGIRLQLCRIEREAFGKENSDLAMIVASYKNPNLHFITAHNAAEKNKTIGYLAFGKSSKFEHHVVASMAVREAYRNNGVARKMVEVMEGYCKRNNINYLISHVSVADGLAEKVKQRYGCAVEECVLQEAQFGQQEKMLINLQKYWDLKQRPSNQ